MPLIILSTVADDKPGIGVESSQAWKQSSTLI